MSKDRQTSTLVDEKLELNFRDEQVKGSSTAIIEGQEKEWAYSGYKQADHFALSYQGVRNVSVLGTVLMRQDNNDTYIGHWERKLCSTPPVFIKCPYVLVKGSGSNLRRAYNSQLSQSCVELEFDTNSTAVFTEGENSCS